MAPKQVTLPVDDGDIYRGDDWGPIKVRFHRDISAAAFACQLRRDRWGAPFDVVIDSTHKTDPVDPDNPDDDPYITLFLPGAVTALIEDNALKGDLQDSPTHTVFKFRVGVKGEYTKPEEP